MLITNYWGVFFILSVSIMCILALFIVLKEEEE